jgi:hypothetical protein
LPGDEELRFKWPSRFRSIYMDITLVTSADRAEANDQASLGEREGENWSAPGSGAMPI